MAEEGAAGEEGVLPVDLRRFMTTGALIQANSGAGKSYFLRYVLEQTHGAVQQVVFDLESEFSTLRERFAYVLVSADDEGDVPADPASAAILCRRLIEIGASAILDLSDMDPPVQQRFTKIFLETLLTLKMHRPLLVAIDEAARVAPESSLGTAESTDSVVSLVTRARKRRICAILAGHRLADLKKGAVGPLHNKFVGRIGLDTDLKRAADDLGMSRSSRPELKTLEPGTFFAYGPAVSPNGITRVRAGGIVTTHLDPADLWDDPEPRVSPPPQESVKQILSRLEDLPAEAEREARNADELREKVRHLQARLAEHSGTSPGKKKDYPRSQTKPEVEREIDRRVERRLIKEIERAKRPLEDEIAVLQGTLGAARRHTDELNAVLTPTGGRTEEASAGRTATEESRDKPGDVALRETDAREHPALAPKTDAEGEGTTATRAGGPDLPDARKRILRALAFLRERGIASIARTSAAVLSDQSPRSSAYEEHVSSLRKAGLVEYPTPGAVALTERGAALAGSTSGQGDPPAGPASAEELHKDWISYLPPAQGRIVYALTSCYPAELAREVLARRTGQSPNSSAFDDHVAALGPKGLGLLEYPRPKHVRASALLFPPGLPQSR